MFMSKLPTHFILENFSLECPLTPVLNLCINKTTILTVMQNPAAAAAAYSLLEVQSKTFLRKEFLFLNVLENIF